MFIYEKKLQYPIRIKQPNPALAKVIVSQYGGPNGELALKTKIEFSQRRRNSASKLLTEILPEYLACWPAL